MEKTTVPKTTTSWEERINSFFDTPKPSYLLPTLSSLYFPHDDKSIFDQLPDLCKKFFKDGVISKELKNTQLVKIQQLLKGYLGGDLKKMSNLVEYCNKYYMNIMKSRDSMQLLPFTITFSFLHLTVLLENNINQLVRIFIINSIILY